MNTDHRSACEAVLVGLPVGGATLFAGVAITRVADDRWRVQGSIPLDRQTALDEVFNPCLPRRPKGVEHSRTFRCRVCRYRMGQLDMFMVHAELWSLVAESRHDLLCLNCVEARLGRPLTGADFTDCPRNVLSAAARSRTEPALLAERDRAYVAWAVGRADEVVRSASSQLAAAEEYAAALRSSRQGLLAFGGAEPREGHPQAAGRDISA